MKRFFLPFSIAAFASLVCAASAAKPNKKAPSLASSTPAPQAGAKKAAEPDAAPIGAELPSPWHTWSDPQGHQIEAEFCSLYGQTVTVRNHEGQTFQMSLLKLVPADTAFATDYAKRLRARSFADDYVKRAAYQIDFLIGTTLVAKGQKFNPQAGEEQFVRRVYLDSIGRIPTAEEMSSYLADTAPDKRPKLIDKLLYSPGYTMHMYNWMGDMLRMKDTFGKGVPAFTFQDWLKDQLHADRPWDSLVRKMLTADGKLCDNGATGFLLYDAQMPLDGVSNLLTTFLGANVACAQCHNHPLAQWKQRDFYQMAAFFGASDGVDEKMLRNGQQLAKQSGLPKGAVQKIASANAYRMADTDKQTLTFPKDYKYSDVAASSPVKPTLIAWSKADAANPAYKINTGTPAQLREEFAKWMTHPDNPRFAANIANRVWKKVFGLAVQEPVADLDDPTKASNPALLAYLAQIIKYGKFDLREFQRVLFNSQTYQRAASISPDLEKGPYLFPGPLVRRMTAEQVWDSLVVLSVGPEVDNMVLRRGDDEKLMSVPGAMTAENVKSVIARMKDAGVKVPAGGGKGAPGKGGALAGEFEGGTPQQRFGMLLARASELPQPAPETHFLRLFGQSDRLITDTSTTDGSVPQALMLMNGGAGQLVSDPNCAAVTVAGKAATPEGKVDSLYLAFVGRKPTDDERTAAVKALTTGLGISDVAWALANTREFLFVQ
ncbi:MAG TPA: DUF1549 domain-containing protein [Chthoniobacteraceae bacterium]|jgi:hypothetical protein|nr:DUF1549 domain-containing protein [Chthoniobacteraceae bacterium]